MNIPVLKPTNLQISRLNEETGAVEYFKDLAFLATI